jgi:hypothetical protein
MILKRHLCLTTQHFPPTYSPQPPHHCLDMALELYICFFDNKKTPKINQKSFCIHKNLMALTYVRAGARMSQCSFSLPDWVNFFVTIVYTILYILSSNFLKTNSLSFHQFYLI